MADREGNREQHGAERQERRETERYERRTSRAGLTIGLIFITLGAIFLANNLFPDYGFGRLWPSIIIAWGFAVVVSSFIPPFSASRLLHGLSIGTIGVILLYNTLGLVSYSFWLNLIDLWPILLIAAGFSILASVAGSRILSLLPSLIILGVLVAALFYQDAIFGAIADRGFTNYSPSRELPSGVNSGVVDIDFAIGSLIVGSTGKLYEVKARELSRIGEPVIEYRRSGNTVNLDMKPRRNYPSFRGNRQRQWKAYLSKDIDWNLRINSGVSDSNYDLSDLKVKRLDLDGGVGDVTVRFGNRVNRLDANIDTGVSNIRVMVPKSAGLQMNIDGGLSTIDFDNIDVQRSEAGDRTVYRTEGFDTAKNKIVLDVDIGISSFTIEGY